MATEFLFNQICISKLHADRHAFLNIASSAHLAHHVRVLVWEELAYEGDVLTAYLAEDDDHWGRDDTYHALVEDLAALFWLPRFTIDDDFGAIDAVASFLSHFQATIDSMLFLNTFVSKPMHPYRELLSQLSSYSRIMFAFFVPS